MSTNVPDRSRQTGFSITISNLSERPPPLSGNPSPPKHTYIHTHTDVWPSSTSLQYTCTVQLVFFDQDQSSIEIVQDDGIPPASGSFDAGVREAFDGGVGGGGEVLGGGVAPVEPDNDVGEGGQAVAAGEEPIGEVAGSEGRGADVDLQATQRRGQGVEHLAVEPRPAELELVQRRGGREQRRQGAAAVGRRQKVRRDAQRAQRLAMHVCERGQDRLGHEDLVRARERVADLADGEGTQRAEATHDLGRHRLRRPAARVSLPLLEGERRRRAEELDLVQRRQLLQLLEQHLGRAEGEAGEAQALQRPERRQEVELDVVDVEGQGAQGRVLPGDGGEALAVELAQVLRVARAVLVQRQALEVGHLLERRLEPGQVVLVRQDDGAGRVAVVLLDALARQALAADDVDELEADALHMLEVLRVAAAHPVVQVELRREGDGPLVQERLGFEVDLLRRLQHLDVDRGRVEEEASVNLLADLWWKVQEG